MDVEEVVVVVVVAVEMVVLDKAAGDVSGRSGSQSALSQLFGTKTTTTTVRLFTVAVLADPAHGRTFITTSVFSTRQRCQLCAARLRALAASLGGLTTPP